MKKEIGSSLQTAGSLIRESEKIPMMSFEKRHTKDTVGAHQIGT
jgi:hypothetical protein